MVIKIDLEKAYDRLERSFIRSILTYFGFPAKIVKLILSCVSTTSTSILVNRINHRLLYLREELGKEILSHLTYLFCVWSSWVAIFIPSVKKDLGLILKPLEEARVFLIFSLLMTYYFLLKQIPKIVRLSRRCCRIFVICLVKKNQHCEV
jgi:hypothetical protein